MASSSSNPGPGVDASGLPVQDPTKNVLESLAAAVTRLDDLRAADDTHRRDMTEMRVYYEKLLREQDKELRMAETGRIDAIRQVDISAVARASEVAATAATVLQTQVQTTAEAARTNLVAALEPIMKDIQELRKSQYELQGAKTQSQFSTGTLITIGLGLVVSVFAYLNLTKDPGPAAEPTVITVPVPASPTTIG